MSRFISKYTEAAEWLNYFIFLLTICTLPFPWHFTQPLIVAWGISWLLEGRWLQRKYLRISRSQIPLLLIVVLIVWEAVTLLWAEDVAYGLSQFSTHIPLLTLPLASLFGVNKHYNIVKSQIVLYIAALFSVFAYLLLVYWAKVNTLVVFDNLVDVEIWNIFNTPPVYDIMHHSYYCPVILLAICCSEGLYSHFRQIYPRWSVILTLGAGDLILLLTIFMSGARNTILLLPIILIMVIWKYRHHRYTKHISIAITVIVLTFGTYIWKHTGIGERLQEAFVWVDYEESKHLPFDHREPRIYLWHIILHDVTDYGWAGMGVGSADGYLDRAYERDGYWDVIECSLGAHNQYLQTWMELGPIAMIFLIFIVLTSPFFHSKRIRWMSVYISLIYGWSMLTECYFSRMAGIYQLCFAIILLIAMEDERCDEKITKTAGRSVA